MSWWNPFSWLAPHDGDWRWGGQLIQTSQPPPVPSSPVAAAPQEPKPAPPPPPFDPDADVAKHLVFTVFRRGDDGVRIGVRVPSTIHGGGDIFDMGIGSAARLGIHLERAILAAEVMEGEHDDLFDDEPEPEKDAACGEGGKS